MHSFELKTLIAAAPATVFAAITDPKYITQWDYCRWAQNDGRVGGKLRKRDQQSRLVVSEIVQYEAPYRFAVVTPILLNSDEPDEGQFLVRLEYALDAHEDKSSLTVRAQGFPTEELAVRERNAWGGYFLEKIKKVAEKGKAG